MSVRSSKPSSPPTPSNQTSLNILHIEELTRSSQIVDCRFSKVDLDFISCEVYNFLTENNSFINYSNDMIDCFPIVLNSGASLSITPFKDDFTSDIQIPENKLKLGGIAQGLSIKAKTSVKWSFQSPKGNEANRSIL